LRRVSITAHIAAQNNEIGPKGSDFRVSGVRCQVSGKKKKN
jgi:hypothetical protein